MKKIAALVSGGVDSAVALARYIEIHPEDKTHITAYYLKIWLEDELAFLGECPWEEDLYFVEKVTKQLGIDLKIIPLQREYYDIVVAYTIDELKAGRTPSPDIFCNHFIKFGAFLNKIDDVDYIISGHYARIVHLPTQSHLYRSPDKAKDQTYFLSHLTYEQVQHIILPLGDMQQSEVRAYAQEKKLAPGERKDSQGICFLGKIKYNDFVKYHLGTKKGDIINIETGTILGAHEGSWFHTIGQRSGLGLGGGPWYVAKKSLDENTIWVQHADKLSNNIVSDVCVSHLHIINKEIFFTNTNNEIIIMDNILVKIRHGEKITSARLEYNLVSNEGTVRLEEGDKGVAAGQFTVLYRDDECIGCAKIQD